MNYEQFFFFLNLHWGKQNFSSIQIIYKFFPIFINSDPGKAFVIVKLSGKFRFQVSDW